MERNVFTGSLLLLIVSFLIYFIRYPMWNYFSNVEPIFLMLFLFYATVLFTSLLLKRDSKVSLSEVFKWHNPSMVLIGIGFALLFQVLWFSMNIAMHSEITLTSFGLSGFENYATYSIVLGFGLYLFFSVFGGFAEEVAYRGYVQTRVTSRHGQIVGIVLSSLFFSLVRATRMF